MKDTPLSNCERDFLLKAIEEKKRLDGRQTYDYRNIKITFGTDYGCCFVDLGKTRVMAQVSCELVAPKETRPNEGILFFNIELSPMASPAFEPELLGSGGGGWRERGGRGDGSRRSTKK
uniref:Exoribonuclease phosphorolytic domain-containing protein n=1 Tax=Periophthalmus magnuspinnatus TaxID=409849 RepID=A0A3B4B3C6_9GOBI